MSDQQRFYITTPIFYPNAKLHMGHAYTTTISDILARYHRLMGGETYFLTGSDENTQKMVDAARKAGQEPLQFLDGIVGQFQALFTGLGISYDQYIRTTDQEVHWPGAQEIWRRIEASGDLYEKEYEGLYCVGHEAFITEKDLVDGKCPDHGAVPETLREKNWFFRLSNYQNEIRARIESGELKIVPETRKKEILSFIDSGLEDVSFSRPRKTDWPEGLGIPVPGDPSQVMYVWCDALSNYATAVGLGRDPEMFAKWWPANLHVIGKDILRFHAAIWPGMLLSAGLPLPRALLVHGFITSGGKKMSKSLGNVIDPETLIAEYGAEATRYLLARLPTFEDGDMTLESLKEAYNAELANGIGNLASRVLKLASTHLAEGLQPPVEPFPQEYTEALENFDVSRAVEYIRSSVQKLDQKIAETEPFKVVKTDPEKGKEMIRELASELYIIGRLLFPVMPETNAKIKQLIKENRMPDQPLFSRKD